MSVPGPKVIKLFSCPQLSMKISQLINMKMPILVGIFMFISRENFMLSWVEQEKSFIMNLRACFNKNKKHI